ncbi:hypothetical protein CWE12_07975 [Aliidiomarina sedimenti]|uniref:Uncharacterized protein n=1 Tax=Aliidiomarina sedimenti TaxID=1933879 RepID=A0ABY0BZ50_9GAMM|nr:hypothetical protein [Aliidiomarina sedimenti]RUO29899.1 hypothetical protein CWE12_07975 [Aliidiomarina sedimenti]
MSTLLGYLSQFTDSKQPRVHNYGPNVQSTQTFKAVAKQAKALRNQYAAVAGSRLALTLTASADALVHMVALDGFVAELILLPVDHAVPKGCHFHISERGQLRDLNDYSSDNLPVVTQWGLLDEHGDVISYSLDELANNDLVQKDSIEHPLRWGVMQEPAELAGLLVWLRALRHGEDIVLAQADTLNALADMFIHAEVNAIAAPPRLWRNLTASEEITRLALHLALVNGGIVDAATLQRLENLFPDAMLAHSFSNTGAGVSWLIDDREPGLPVSLFAANDDGLKLEINDAQLDIRFTGSGATIHTGYLAVKQDQRVFLLGHQDNQLMVGGRGVQPEVVEQALLQVVGVADVQASSMPNPVLGELVRVDVLAPSQRTVAERKLFKRTLQEHCRECLEPWQRPARYYFH